MACACKDCKDITLFKGSDGVGIQHIEFSGCCPTCPNTFTIFLTDGTSYTSPNLFCALPDFAEVIVEAGEGIEVDSVTAGNTTTYTVSLDYRGMRANGTPQVLPIVAPNVSVGLQANGVTQILPEVYDDDNAYNPLTGIWTCPATGKYDLSFYVHLTSTSIGFSEGMIIAGITAPTSNSFYCINSITFNQVNRHADIAGSDLGRNITAGTQLALKILNTSNVNYNAPIVGDVAILSIKKVG